MTIGIITFHRANNIGATLQAYALQKYIDENIAECELIDFMPNNLPQKNTKPRKLLRLCRRIITPIEYFFSQKKRARFYTFRKQFYKLSKKEYWGDSEIRADPPRYDLLVSGSDQIFNLTLSGDSESYYLNFIERTPKISYASSFGRTDISPHERLMIKEELVKFKKISVREESAAKIIYDEIGVNPICVADPVFLLKENFWRGLRNNKYKINGEYILVYSMEYSEWMAKTINKAKVRYHMPIYIVCGSKSARRLNGKKLYDVGPQEFLSLLIDAKYIITNSFHGTAFSIILMKKFWCISHSSKNTRIENILNITGNSHKLIRSDSEKLEDKIIDGEESYQKIESLIALSKQYLEKYLKI